MIRLLKFLWYGHCHDYEILSKFNIRYGTDIIGTKWILKCKKCGNLEEFKSME